MQDQPKKKIPGYKEAVEYIPKRAYTWEEAKRQTDLAKKNSSKNKKQEHEEYTRMRNEAAKKAVEEMLKQQSSLQEAMDDLDRLKAERLGNKQ